MPRTSSKPKKTATSSRDGDTEQRILDAAHAVFARHGTAGARMQDIAKEARVNQALLHYYFRSKARLSDAVFLRAAAQLMPQVIQVMASDLTLADKVKRVVHLELDHLLRTPYLPGYIISELHHHPERLRQLASSLTGLAPEDLRQRVIGKLKQQLDAGARAGRIRHIAADQFMVNIMSLCIFPFAARPMIATVLGLDQDGFERFIHERRDQLVAFCLGAMRP
ncbi:MAG TPA: TetR/AcrR family transcriptional regulator [Vicinamibacterales bacterium]|jgi:AcrR family transcriptional regulator